MERGPTMGNILGYFIKRSNKKWFHTDDKGNVVTNKYDTLEEAEEAIKDLSPLVIVEKVKHDKKGKGRISREVGKREKSWRAV